MPIALLTYDSRHYSYVTHTSTLFDWTGLPILQQKNASLQKRAYEVEQGLVDDSADALDNDEEGGDKDKDGAAAQGLAGNIMMVKR